MARYIQDPVTHKLVPADSYCRPQTVSHSIHGFHEPYVSPVDGSIISDARSLRNHNAKNNVVHSAEFDSATVKKQQAERKRILSGEHTPQETQARKQEMYETIIRAERAN